MKMNKRIKNKIFKIIIKRLVKNEADSIKHEVRYMFSLAKTPTLDFLLSDDKERRKLNLEFENERISELDYWNKLRYKYHKEYKNN